MRGATLAVSLKSPQADESHRFVCSTGLRPPMTRLSALSDHRHLHTTRFVVLANLCLDSVRRAGLGFG
jgi:hypothetical protein